MGLKWSVENWITVLLMVGVGYAVIGLVRGVVAGGLSSRIAMPEN